MTERWLRPRLPSDSGESIAWKNAENSLGVPHSLHLS